MTLDPSFNFSKKLQSTLKIDVIDHYGEQMTSTVIFKSIFVIDIFSYAQLKLYFESAVTVLNINQFVNIDKTIMSTNISETGSKSVCNSDLFISCIRCDIKVDQPTQ